MKSTRYKGHTTGVQRHETEVFGCWAIVVSSGGPGSRFQNSRRKLLPRHLLLAPRLVQSLRLR
jgi:hypothetical protein